MNFEKYLDELKIKVTELGIRGAIIGLSGGKDSNIVAKLMVDILGAENVIGVMIPNNSENDAMAIEISNYLGINTLSVDIGIAFNSIYNNVNYALSHPAIINQNIAPRFLDQNIHPPYNPNAKISLDAKINLAPRLRMSVLYAVAQSMGNGWRVIGTTNKSENYIGWLTKWGDGGVDFEPIISLSVTDLHELGDYIGLPKKFVYRVPVDGLTPKTDEERFGFSYEQLDHYMETGSSGDDAIDEKIQKMHRYSEHKRNPIPFV